MLKQIGHLSSDRDPVPKCRRASRSGDSGEYLSRHRRTGIGSDETMKNVVQLVRQTRKSKDTLGLPDIVDWSFAKKAQAELKTK
jgi:hypothetical protein